MGKPKRRVVLPEGDLRLPPAEHMFESTTLFFGKKPAVAIVCDSRAQAELLAEIANTGYRGPISIPTTEEACRSLHKRLIEHLARVRAEFERLARERAGSERLQAQIVDTLWGWFLYGGPPSPAKQRQEV